MARKFKEARQMHKLTIAEAADRLGVSSAALSTWESEKKSPTLDNLIGMAEFYGVTTDYLLGRANEPQGNTGNRPLVPEELRIRNGMPVWSDRHSWLLVDAAASCLLRSDGTKLPLLDAGELFVAETANATAPLPERNDFFRRRGRRRRDLDSRPGNDVPDCRRVRRRDHRFDRVQSL